MAQATDTSELIKWGTGLAGVALTAAFGWLWRTQSDVTQLKQGRAADHELLERTVSCMEAVKENTARYTNTVCQLQVRVENMEGSREEVREDLREIYKLLREATRVSAENARQIAALTARQDTRKGNGP